MATERGFRQRVGTGHSLLRCTTQGECRSRCESCSAMTFGRWANRRGVHVTAHRRALWLRIGTVAAVAAGALVGAATPAFAAAKVDINVDPNTTNLTVGGSPQTI